MPLNCRLSFRNKAGLAHSGVLALIGLLSAATAEAAGPLDKKTERTWKANCASCHGADGKGQTEQGQKMGVANYADPEWQKSRTDDQIRKSIQDGVKREKDGRQQEMDPFKEKLKPEQIDALVAYIRTLAK